MDAKSQEEIQQDGLHLAQVREAFGLLGASVVFLIPEVGAHVGDEAARQCGDFLQQVLAPACEVIDRQLAELQEQYVSCTSEVDELETMFKQGA